MGSRMLLVLSLFVTVAVLATECSSRNRRTEPCDGNQPLPCVTRCMRSKQSAECQNGVCVCGGSPGISDRRGYFK
ncbi:hypothetical protein MTO96_030640 [Rhipicephalus appendiculatus]